MVREVWVVRVVRGVLDVLCFYVFLVPSVPRSPIHEFLVNRLTYECKPVKQDFKIATFVLDYHTFGLPHSSSLAENGLKHLIVTFLQCSRY